MNERSATALTIGPEQIAAPGDAFTPVANDARAPKRVVISLRDLRKSYTSANGEKIEVLRGVNLDVEAGSFNVIRGESGSGKTSLLRILGMLDTDF
jgi:ABC-type glutathione transport system ATPase component